MSANDSADLARPFPSDMLLGPVRCALGGGHETTGIYQFYRWRCGNVAACGAGAAIPKKNSSYWIYLYDAATAG